YNVEKRRRPSRSLSKPARFAEYFEDSDSEIKPLVKKSRSVSRKRCSNGNPTTPQCFLCETYPTTTYGYTAHLYIHHNKSTLAQNGIYLNCSCGLTVTSQYKNSKHSKECTRIQFTLHKMDEK
ncbi:hypothetical protein PENTCL1PPCAC_19794, partial [Pristionchus entomophagus]